MADWWTEWKKKNGVVTKPINQKAENPAPAQKAAPQADWWTKLKTQNNYQAAGQAADERKARKEQERQEELARLRAQELAKYGPEPIKPVQLSAQSQAFLDPLEQFKNGKAYYPRSFMDRDSVLQGKAYEAAAKGTERAALDGDVSLYAKNLRAAQKAAGRLQESAEYEDYKYLKEHPDVAYARRLSADEISGKLQETARERAALEARRKEIGDERQEMRLRGEVFSVDGHGVAHYGPKDTALEQEDREAAWRMKELEEETKALQSALGMRQQQDLLDGYQALRSNPDFAEKSQFVSTKHGNGKSKVNPISGVVTDSGYDDPIYDAINGDENARNKVRLDDLNAYAGNRHDNWYKISDEDRQIYNYLHATRDKEEAENYLKLIAEYKTSGIEAAMFGLLRGSGLSSLTETAANLTGMDTSRLEPLYQTEALAQKQNPGAYSVGSVAGNLALMAGAGKLAGGAAKALGLGGAKVCTVKLGGDLVKVYTTPLTTKMATSAMTFALTDAVQNAGSLSAGRMSAGEYLGSIGKGAAGGAAGSLASYLVDTGMAAWLNKMGWMTPFGEYTRRVAASSSFSVANIGTKQLLSEDKMSAEEASRQLVSAFLFNLVSSGLETIKTTREYKAGMDALKENIAQAYSKLSDAGLSPEQKAELAQQVMDWSQQLKTTINGLYLPGQQKYVNDMNTALDGMTDLMAAYGNINAQYASWGGSGNLLNGGSSGGMEMAPYGQPGGGPSATEVQNMLEPQIQEGLREGIRLAEQEGVGGQAMLVPTVENAGSAPQPSAPQTLTPSPQGEGLGGRAVLAPTEDGRQGAVPMAGDGGQIARATEDGRAMLTHTEGGGQIARATENGRQIADATDSEVRAAWTQGRETALKEGPGMATDTIAAMIQANDENALGARQEGNTEQASMFEGVAQGLREVYEQRLADTAQDNGLGTVEDLGRVGEDRALAETPPHPSAPQALTPSPLGEGLDGRQGAVPTGNGGQVARATEDTDGGGRILRSAQNDNMGGLNDGTAGDQGIADGGQRDGGLGAGGQAGGLGEGTEGSVAGGESGTRINDLKNYVKALGAEKQSSREIGIIGGTKNASVIPVDVEALSGKLHDSLAGLQEKAARDGVRLDFVLGKMEVRQNGATTKSSGVFQVDRDGTPHVFIQADSLQRSPEQLYEHEMFHAIVARSKSLWRDIVNDLYENHTEEEIRTMVEAYVSAYQGCYGTEDADVDLYLEELFADVYAGMQRGDSRARKARELAAPTAQRFAGDIENARQNRAGIERRNGPGFRFSAEEEAAMQEEGITVTSGPSALKKNQDNKSVSHVLAKNISNLEDMKPLAHLSGNEMNDKSKDLYTQIKEWFNSFGNKETREGFGTVLFDDYGVGGVMNHRPLNRAKLVTLMAAREIVKNGKQISYEPNWKGRGYDSFIFAGPVTVGPNNDLIYVAAVVDKQQDNKFYLNECVDSDGNYVRINESSPSSTKTGFTVQDGVTRGLGEPSKNSISQNKSKNNPVQEKINSREDSGEIDWIGNRGQKFSPAEDEGDIEYDDGLEFKGELRRSYETDSSPAAQNDEDGGDSAVRADVGIGPYEGKGGQVARATEENGGRPVTASTEAEGLAKEKKAEIAERASIEGLKSRIETEKRNLSKWKSLESAGLVTEAAKKQELKKRIADVQETLDIFEAELKQKKAAKKAEKADEAKQAEKKAQRKAEKLAAQKEAELADNRPRQARKEFRQDALKLFSVQTGKRQALGDILNEFADRLIEKKSVTAEDRAELFRQLYEAGVEVVQAEDYYKNIRETVDNARIYVPESVRAEFGDDWKAFRDAAWGNGVYLTNSQSDRGADSWNAELAELFPGAFDAAETDAKTMLENIVDLAREGKAEFVSLGEMMRRNQAETGVTVDEQMDELERKMDQLIDTFAQKAELEVKTRKQGMMKLVKERQKNREMAARQVQRKRENDTRNQVMTQLRQLSKMRKRSAPEIQRQIDEIIGNLDTMARSISPEGLENLQALARKYREAEQDPNFLGNPYVKERLDRLSQVQLDSLEISDVIELGRMISGLVKTVTEDKRLLTDERNREISEAAKDANREIASSAGSKGGKLREFFGSEHLSPTREIQRLGGWVRGGVMEKLSRALEDGGTRRMEYQRQATRIFDKFLSDKSNQKWLQKAQGKDADWISVTVPAGITAEDGSLKIQNVTLELTPMMRVGLLMHSRNVDNLRHIETGGIVIPNKEFYRKGDLANADAKGTRVKLRPEVVRGIVKDCTPQERAFAALLEQYYDGLSKDKINEVSMLIDGFERAGGDHYYGIKVSRKFLASAPEQVKRDMSLESIGSIVNERVHAGNPIILEDASTALKDHIDLISKYYGYTAAIRDFNAVMNYTFHQGAEEGAGVNAYAGSVKETLQDKWGAGAQKYMDELLADLQQSSGINETAAQFLAKLRGNLAGASLMFNPAVALSQTASLPGAAQSLGFDALIAGLKPQKVDMGLVEKYSPVLWYRNQGNSTQELGDYMSRQGLEGKLPFFFNWIQKMDSWTIRRLWAAAEYRVSKDTDLSPGSKEQIDAGTDPYYQEVARVFQRAVYDTQPNYSEMQRPAILRSKSDLMKMLTMYKTVPLQYYNMMYEAAGRLRADKARFEQEGSAENKANYAKSRSFAATTFAGVLGANVVYVVMKALVKGLLAGKDDRFKDEEGELDAGKIFGGLGKDLVETYAGSVIFGSELLSFIEKQIEGGSYNNRGVFEISALSALNTTISKIQNLRNEIADQDYWGARGKIKDLAKQLVMDFGIPANNIETYLLGTMKWMAPEWVDRYENFFDEFERSDLKGEHGRELRAAIRVLMDNRTDGLKDETIDELTRLWGNGETMQVPSAIPTDFEISGEERVLSADERDRYREIWNQTVSGNLETLIGSEAYQKADDKGKASMIKKLYEYAGQLAKEETVQVEPEPWVRMGQACEETGISLADYLTVAAVNKDKLADMDGTELNDAIQNRMRFRAGELSEDRLTELARLYAGTDKAAIPGDVPTAVKVNGEEQKLTPAERAAWMQAWKQAAGDNLESVMGSKLFKSQDDKGKAKTISDLYKLANAYANAAVEPGYEPNDRWITAGLEAQKQGVPLDEYVLYHEQLSGVTSEKQKIGILKEQGWEDRQKETVWLKGLADETQVKKYENLKNGGASWENAMAVMDIGGDATEGLTEEQTAVYNRRWEEITSTTTKRLMATSAYKNANDEGKEALVDKLNTYASAVARAEATGKASKEAWVNAGISATKAGVNLEEYIVFTKRLSEVDGKDSSGESVDGLARQRGLKLLNDTGWSDKQKEIVFLESSMTDESAEEKEKQLRSAGLTWKQTSDVMGTLGSNTEKAYAVINSGASDSTVYKALEVYLEGSSLKAAQVGITYEVDIRYWASARKEASTDGNKSVNQEEATAYIDNLPIGWEEKAYLWQMVCYQSKWMKNPYSTTLGKEIWHSLHPGE